MYMRARAGYEKALGPDHTSTLTTVHSLEILYKDHGKSKEAEYMFVRHWRDVKRLWDRSIHPRWIQLFV